MMPLITGNNLSNPLPNIITMMETTNATKASSQSVFAMSTAVPESDKPINMMTGPITTGGKSLSSSCMPFHFTKPAIKK